MKLHTVRLGGGASTKEPIIGASVRVFDRNDAAFQALWTKNPNGTLYGDVYENGAGKIASCVTSADGTCMAGESASGDYLVIVKYFDSQTGKTVYTGLPKSPSDFKDTNGDGIGDLATKEFQIIKVIKKDGAIQFSGGNKTVVTGSILEIIYPVASVWESGLSKYIYPFIFTADSDWIVDVCGEVPTGYQITGIYNELGDLITTDNNCVQTFVANETKVIAFDVLDIASPPEFAAVFRIKAGHPGKSMKKLDLNVPSFVKDNLTANDHIPDQVKVKLGL